jgi:hypothetical protein
VAKNYDVLKQGKMIGSTDLNETFVRCVEQIELAYKELYSVRSFIKILLEVNFTVVFKLPVCKKCAKHNGTQCMSVT